ncbi:N-acetyltransferase family protein [Spongiivirga sp. MCCC 1A20706]|uniref:GNAT family N-acetyltransferase n=1 Tax=Spongiivirga sp. MCCC 1A20706 TaxID=3160963 RepID=UPI003977BD2D
MVKEDWPQVAAIYQEGLDTGIATFETVVPDWETWDKTHLEVCRLVAVNDGLILGWAALSKVSNRQVYRGVAEVSIYIGKSARGRKVGQQLLENLIVKSEEAGFWTLQSGIFPENKASLMLHEKMGFRIIGYRERVAVRNGKWYDNCLLERRSPIIGVE